MNLVADGAPLLLSAFRRATVSPAPVEYVKNKVQRHVTRSTQVHSGQQIPNTRTIRGGLASSLDSKGADDSPTN